jgi:hypothetical protein
MVLRSAIDQRHKEQNNYSTTSTVKGLLETHELWSFILHG